MTRVDADRLVERVLDQLTVGIEASGRHVHLNHTAVEALFGPGHRLEPVRPLSQPGQFVCAERVTLVGPKGVFQNVAVLGPERPESQVELSLTDGTFLGLRLPVRLSGEIEGTPGLTLCCGERSFTLKQGAIAAKRHIHLRPEDAERFGVRNGQNVGLRCFTDRPLIFGSVEVRVSPRFASVVHLDYDEANACGFVKGDRGMILP